MTSPAFILYLLGGALCLHYSSAVSVPACPLIACDCLYETVWTTDIRGCKICSCRPLCPQLNCLDVICSDGFAFENDCPTCRCKQPPRCPDIATELCINGTVTDINGCIVCQNNTFPCKPLRCPAIFCPDGYVKDSYGCDTCQCKQEICPEMACKCPYGTVWTTDIRGCKICSCRTLCPQLNCLDVICPDGFAFENDCPTCRCKQPPHCPDIATELCINGTVTDINGCIVCQNNTLPCKPRICPAIACPNGYVKDSSGCDTCQCKPKICPVIACKCPYGTKWIIRNGCRRCSCLPKPVCPKLNCLNGICPNGVVTENNCPTCRCKQPSHCPDIATELCTNGTVIDKKGCIVCQNNTFHCKPQLCAAIACEIGYEKDSNGCDTCQCICPLYSCPAPENCEYEFFRNEIGCTGCRCRCPAVLCPDKCPFGYATDSAGCPTCECKPYECPTEMCTLDCPHGFELDKRGCQACLCKTS